MKAYSKSTPAPTHFEFPPLPASGRLRFEPLDERNAWEVFELFADDPSPFILDDYKQAHLWRQYVAQHLHITRYSLKRAGYDWVYHRRHDHAVVGVINLYGLSRERWAGQRPTATLGFTTGAAYRRQGYTQEAVEQLVAYSLRHFDVAAVVAFTERDNHASQGLLQKVGFAPVPHDTSNRFLYFERAREAASPG